MKCRAEESARHFLFELHFEGHGEEFGEGHSVEAVGCGEEDRGGRQDELGEHLSAGATGRAGGFVQVGDGDGFDADVGSELGDGSDQSGTLGADGEAVADIFHICAGDGFAIGEAESCTDAEVGVGSVSVLRGMLSGCEEVLELCVDWIGVWHWFHLVSWARFHANAFVSVCISAKVLERRLGVAGNHSAQVGSFPSDMERRALDLQPRSMGTEKGMARGA